jgi:hypothetical protein
MFDLETLDTVPSAVILSIGAVLFERDGNIMARFYRVIDTQSQLDAGRTVSQNTLLWWLQQDPTARAEAFSPSRCNVWTALNDFMGFASNTSTNIVTKFWCNGPSFDGVLWESLARDFSQPAPWRYNQLRDQRTLVDAAGLRVADFRPTPEIIGIPHTPVYDCEFQVAVITACRRILNGTAAFDKA